MTSELSSLCSYAKGKVSVDTLSKRNYVSTENMMPNKGGIVDAGALPSAQYTQQYIKDDILVSNIRPYFKKIWMADDDGGCSMMFSFSEQIAGVIRLFVLHLS